MHSPPYLETNAVQLPQRLQFGAANVEQREPLAHTAAAEHIQPGRKDLVVARGATCRLFGTVGHRERLLCPLVGPSRRRLLVGQGPALLGRRLGLPCAQQPEHSSDDESAADQKHGDPKVDAATPAKPATPSTPDAATPATPGDPGGWAGLDHARDPGVSLIEAMRRVLRFQHVGSSVTFGHAGRSITVLECPTNHLSRLVRSPHGAMTRSPCVRDTSYISIAMRLAEISIHMHAHDEIGIHTLTSSILAPAIPHIIVRIFLWVC